MPNAEKEAYLFKENVRLQAEVVRLQKLADQLAAAGDARIEDLEAEIERLRSEKEVALQSKDRHKARAQHVETEIQKLRDEVDTVRMLMRAGSFTFRACGYHNIADDVRKWAILLERALRVEDDK